MNNIYRRIIAAIGAAALCLSAGCSAQEVSSGGAASGSTPSAESLSSEYIASADSYAWDGAHDAVITLSGDSAKVSGSSAAQAVGSVVTIAGAGSYLVTGALDNGQLAVDADGADTVRIILSGASITCAESAAIYVLNAKQVILTLDDGTENFLVDGGDGVVYDGADPSAALYSADDLVICGGGSLTVNARRNNGIQCKDALAVTGGTLIVNSANDGIKGKDSVAIGNASVRITAGGDGIQSNNDTDAGMGVVTISGGSFAIESASDGIQAESALNISGGSFAIISGGGSEASLASDASAKALKASGALNITGGSFVIDSADDAVHSNGDVSLAGATFSIATGDDGVHADNALTIESGSISISKCYEGFEGVTVTINGGTHSIVASDDGVNSNGGSDGGFGRFGADSFASSGSSAIYINSGTTYVNAQGDGVDSNGNITMTGGVLHIDGPTGSGDGALDYNGSFDITGGELIAAGSAGMAMNVSSAQGLCSVLVGCGSQSGGTQLDLKDASGNTLLSYAPAKNYECVVVASEKLTQGSSYTVSCGDAQAAEFTIDSAVSSSGVTGMGGFGGGFGGGKPQSGDTQQAPSGDMQLPADGSRPERPSGGMGGGNMTPPDGVSGATPGSQSA